MKLSNEQRARAVGMLEANVTKLLSPENSVFTGRLQVVCRVNYARPTQ